ncbi:MAG: RluA family pseudouridine synthase [Patescibacteria group bacterium]|nr:RluA family pseudouridine synthase [Patescibacteria group bacterium]
MSKLKIVFENEDFLVVDKPAGLVVHEGSGHLGDTLVDLLAKHLPNSPLKSSRMGLVHRLDKDTTGLLLVAKTQVMYDYLKKLFKDRKIQKIYLALVEGRLKARKGIIDVPLKRDLVEKTKFVASVSGKTAKTEYEVIDYVGSRTYLKAIPYTGRTHQIRVHFSAIGHPLVGDTKYNRAPAATRLFLHSHQISFIDIAGHPHQFVSALPSDLKLFLEHERAQ